jgi:hypothetical protein
MVTMKLLPNKTNGFDHKLTDQKNQQSSPHDIPRLQEDDLFPKKKMAAIPSLSIGGDGLDHMRLPFAYKLHILLCDMETKGCEHIISWVEEGNAFKIHDRKIFEALIQPHYFKQSKIASFIRQCYMYGFSKVERGPNQGSYVHPEFCKDDQAKSLTIQRHASIRADHKHKKVPPSRPPQEELNASTHTPSPTSSSSTSNSSRLVGYSTTISNQERQVNPDHDTGAAVSSSTILSACQHLSSPDRCMMDSTDNKWSLQVGRHLTMLNHDSCPALFEPLGFRNHTQARPFH